MTDSVVPDPVVTVWKDAVKALPKLDPTLAGSIKKIGIPEVRLVKDPFQATALGIIRQQFRSGFANTLVDRVVAPFGGQFPTAKELLSKGRGVLNVPGLKVSRADQVWTLAERHVNGETDLASIHKLNDDEALGVLMAEAGVGPWTAAMVLMFSLGRPDVFVPGDANLRSALQRLYGLEAKPTKQEMASRADKWRPFRSAAAWYLWRSGENIHPGLA